MKLIASPTSPFARKVRIALLEKQLPCPVEMDIPWNEGTRVPDYNPLGKIPVLVLADGDTVFDSRVIIEYLETLPAVVRLLPENAEARVQARRWEALADGISDAAATIYLEYNKRTPTQQNPEWVARQQLKITRGLNCAERWLAESKSLMEEPVGLGEIAMGCMLGYLSLRFAELDWRAQHPALAALATAWEARASFSATRPQQ